jgi:hypothetical protein
MIKSVMRELVLAIQSKSGITVGAIVWLVLAGFALAVAFVFLCVAFYVWLEARFGGVFAGLIVAGVFALIAAFAALLSALARRRARQRAILARAARAHSGSWLFDPKILGTAVEIGRSLGWRRLVPVALLGFLAAQWAREYRGRSRDDAE